jgi:uncharacterized damage-inducible protein DinB
MTSVLLELFRHKAWATLQLIELVRNQPESTLDATVPGTYGSVRATFRHLANADTNYYSVITQQPFTPLPEGVSLDDVEERIRSLAPLWEQLLQDADAPERRVSNRQGNALGVAPMAQAIHHGDVHRTHILSILGASGVAVPDLDIWEYGLTAGYVCQPDQEPRTPAGSVAAVT